jgi:hypothetical protein
VTLILLIVAALADLALAALLIGVSGFLFGSGPQSMHGGALPMAAYTAAVVACIAAPVAGFVFNARGKSGLALGLAWMPPAGALVAFMVPAPY